MGTGSPSNKDVLNFVPRIFLNFRSYIRVAIDPVNAYELQKVIKGLNCLSIDYPESFTQALPYGGFYIHGTGELYIDNLMRTLRLKYATTKINISEPSVSFNESILDSSKHKCYASTDKKNCFIKLICEPIPHETADKMDEDKISQEWNLKKTFAFFLTSIKWDS